MRLNNKTAIITGTAGGIGKACALLFAREGAYVCINDIDEAGLKATATEAMKITDRVLAFPADVSDYSQAKKMVLRAQATIGRVDILVNNAGIGQRKPFLDITEEDWDRMIDVNLKSVFNCTQAVLPSMLARKAGSIVSVSSLGGISGTPQHVHYSAAKAGIVGFTKALAKEFASRGIRANVVVPGPTDTPMLRSFTAAQQEDALHRSRMGRLGRPEEIAAACLFMASDDASYITGQVLSANGGAYI